MPKFLRRRRCFDRRRVSRLRALLDQISAQPGLTSIRVCRRCGTAVCDSRAHGRFATDTVGGRTWRESSSNRAEIAATLPQRQNGSLPFRPRFNTIAPGPWRHSESKARPPEFDNGTISLRARVARRPTLSKTASLGAALTPISQLCSRRS